MSTSETDSPQSESPACDQQPDVGTVCTDGADYHDELKGYSMAPGAPRKLTQEDLRRALMLVDDIEKACSLSGVPHIADDDIVALHTIGLWSLVILQRVLDGERCDHDSLERLRECGEAFVRGPRLMVNGDTT